MSQTGKRFLSGLFNRVKNTASEPRATKGRGRAQTDRRLGMEPLEERQLLSADPTLLSAFSSAQAADNTAAVAPAAASVSAIDLSSVDSVSVVDPGYSAATLTTTTTHYVNTDISAVLDRFSCDQQGWAATLANLLTYTGWSDNSVVVNPEVDSPIEQQTFDYISNAFTNDQTSLYYAFAWYKEGASEYVYQGQPAYAQIYVGNTDGGLFPATAGEYSLYSDYMTEILAADIPSPLYGITTEYLDNNYGIAIEVHYASNATGSDVTIGGDSSVPKKTWLTYWGYEYDATYEATDVEYYTAIYASNPDTGEVERLPIRWNNALNAYVFTTYNQTTGQIPYIYLFDVLERMPGYGTLELDAYEANNTHDDFVAGTPSSLGQIDVLVPSSTSGSTVYGNTFTLSDLTLFAEGDDATPADPVDYYKFELTQTASRSDSIVVQWQDGVRYQNLKATLYVCSDNVAYPIDPVDYGYVTGHYDSVLTKQIEYKVGSDGKTYFRTINKLTLPLSGLTAGEYFVKVEFADDVVNGVNAEYSVTFNAGYDDVYETNNSFEEVNALEYSTTANPTANLGVLYGTTELSDLVLKQYSNKIDETDWYRFEMTETGTAANEINLYYTSTSSQINDADLDLYLYKADSSSSRGYTLIGKSYVEMTNKETISLEGVEAGVYYIKVVGNYSAGNVEYKLEINPGVSSVPDLRAEVLAGSNWEDPLVVTSEKYVPNGSEIYRSEAVIGVDSTVYLNYSFSVNGSSTKYGAAETAVYEGVKLGMYINGAQVSKSDIRKIISASSYSSALKAKLVALFCSADGLDMQAGDTVSIRNLDLGRMVDESSFAAKYFNSYAQGANSIVIAINPDNYTFDSEFGKIVDERETKEMTLTYTDGSFYNGANVVSVSKGTTVEVYRNNRYLTDVIYGVDDFTFRNGDIILVSLVSHNYKVAVDGYYEANAGVEGVLEYTVDNNFASVIFTVNDLSEDAFAPNASVSDVMSNDNPDDVNPNLGFANIDNLEAYMDGGDVLYHRVIEDLVITGDVNSNGAYTSDWFRFNLKSSAEDPIPNYANAFVEIRIDDSYSGLSATENLGDLDLYLYKIVQTDDTISFEEAYETGAYRLELLRSSKGVGSVEHINFSELNMTDGVYFINVAGFNGSANRYTMELGGFTKSGNILPTDPSEYFKEDSVTLLNSVATVSWEIPVNDYVSSVDVSYRKAGDSAWIKAGHYKPSVTSCKITGLEPETEYEFQLTVSNYFVAENPLSASVAKTTEAFLNETVYRAVIVGVSDYPGSSSDLVAATNDAKAFRSALLKDPQWAEENIQLLTDSDATRDAVIEALLNVSVVSDDNDVFVFYFAGSGTSAVVGGQSIGYLKTCGSVRSEFLSSSDLLAAVERIAAGSKQFILDAGQIAPTAEETGINYAPFVETLTSSTTNGGSERVAQTTVLTSADDKNIISIVGTGSRSVFNHALCDAMEAYSEVVTEEEVEASDDETVVVSDGRVTFSEIYTGISSDERMTRYNVGVSLATNDASSDAVLMSGKWNEADANNEAWLKAGAIVVTTTVDCIDAHDGRISLREAALLVGSKLDRESTLDDNSTFTLAAGSVVTIGTTTGVLVEDVELTYLKGTFRTAETCSLQTETSLVEFNRTGLVTSWKASDWADGSVTLVDSENIKVDNVEYVLVATTTVEGETTSVELKEGDVLTTAETGGKEAVVTKVGQGYVFLVDGVPYTRMTGLYLDGVPATISTSVKVDQIVTINKVIFDESLAGQTLEMNETAGPIVFAKGGVVYASSPNKPITLDGQGQYSLIKASGTELVTIVGLRLVNAGGSAITVDSGASLELANVLLSGAQSGSKGVIVNNGTLYLTNDTIVDNTSKTYLVTGAGTTTLVNTIVALNNAYVSNLTHDTTSIVTKNDPGFTDASNGDYTLLKTSDAIDIGRNSAVKLNGGVVIEYDLAGNDRIGTASTVDAGAYEYTVALEDRETPSTVVTILDDIVDATDEEISLREAIAYAGTTYEVETTLEEGAVVVDENGVSYEVTNGKFVSFDGVTGVQTGQYYAIAGVYIVDDYGEAIELEEDDVVTLANGAKATVVGTKLLLASGIPVSAGTTITDTNGHTGALAYGVTTNFMRNQKISVALTAAAIDPTTPVGAFDPGTYTLSYNANGTFTGTLNITTTDDSNNSSTTSFEATFRLVAGTSFVFLDGDGAATETGSIVTTRTVELEDGRYTLLEPITETIGRTTITRYEAGAILTLTRGVFTDADGVVVTVPKGTTFTSPSGAKVAYQYSNFSTAKLEEGAALVCEDGVTRYYKSDLTLYEQVTLGTNITFKPGLENGTITLRKGALSVERAITLDAALNRGLTINANGKSRVFTIDTYRETNPSAYVALNGLTLVNGFDDEGGFVYVSEDSNLRLTGTSITGVPSRVSSKGGAIYNAGRLALENSTTPTTIVGVSAIDGGAIYNVGVANIAGVDIGNVKTTNAGTIYNAGTMTFAASTISGSSAANGGGFYNVGSLSVTKGSEISGVVADNGAGVYNVGTANIVNSEVSGSTAQYYGGGFYNAGSLTLTNVKIQENEAGVAGGAVYTENKLYAVRTLFAANSADSNGAAIYNSGQATIASSLVIANGDGAAAGRYAIYAAEGSLELVGDTIVGNAFEGVTVNGGANVKIYNTILGENGGYDLNVVSGTADVQYSMVEDSLATISTTNPTYDPYFANFNPGSDWTGWNLRLGSGSPAIDAGSVDYNIGTTISGKTAPITVDYAGNARVTESGVDIGAYSSTTVQEDFSTVVTTWDDVVDPTDGLISLREAIRYASYGKTVADKTVTFSNDLFALSDSGVVKLDSGLKTIVVDTAVVVTTAYTDALGETSYRDVTVDGSDIDSTLFIIQKGADVEMDGLKFTGGHATGENESGGAFIVHSGTLTLLDSVVSGNVADRNGGAIYQDGGVLFVIDSLLSDNAADATRGYGGAICMNGGQAYVYNTTVSANDAAVYGGVFELNGLLVMANSIVAQNGGAQAVDVFATNFEATNNLIGAMDPWASRNGVSGNIVGTVSSPVDPAFTDFAARDFTLQPSSLAINAGVNQYAFGPDGVRLKYDLNANDRIAGGVVDMGAYESASLDVPSTVVTTLEDVNPDSKDASDGLISLREAIRYAAQFGTPITFDLGEDFTGDAEIKLDSTLGAIVVSSDLTIDASNIAGGLTIVGADDSVFKVSRGVLKLDSVALTGGYATNGGAIYQTGGAIELTNVLIYGNEAANEGGAIYSIGGSITSLNSTIAGNSANSIPGVYATGTVDLQNTIVAENARENGTAVENYDLYTTGKLTSTTSVVGITTASIASTFDGYNGNVYGTEESAVDVGFAAAGSFDFSLAEDSIAINAGSNRLIGLPGYYASILQTSTNATVIRTDYAGNERLVGGTVDIGAYEYQISTEAPSVTVTTLEDVVDPFDGVISLREALEYAGSATYVDGVIERVGRTIDFDPSLAGGTIMLNDTLEITKCVTIDATALSSALTISAATIEGGGNAVIINGQKDTVADTITLAGLTITGGEAVNGAGVYHLTGKATLINCVVYGNEGTYGAGITSVADAVLGDAQANTLTLINCTVAGNNATGAYGGVWSRGSDLYLLNTLVAGNTTNGAPGLDVVASSFGEIRSSLIGIANNTLARAYDGTDGNHLGTANSPVDPSFVDAENGDYKLSRSADGEVSIAVNGGDTTLIALPDGSIPAHDADGNLRIIGTMVDIGAYESELGPTEIPSLLVTTLDDVVDPYDGLISLREATAYANNYGLASTITFATRLSGGTIYLNSSLDISKSLTIDGLTNDVVGITLTTADDVVDQSVLYINSGDVVINGLTITNRYTERKIQGQSLTVAQGGAAYVRSGALSLYNSLITDTAAVSGSAIYVNEASESAAINLVNCTVASNVGLSNNETTGAAIYSERGVLNFWNTLVVANKLITGDDAQDVYKGASAPIVDTVVERQSVTINNVSEYADEPLALNDGDTVKYYNTELTYREGKFYRILPSFEYEYTMFDGMRLTVPVTRTLTYGSDQWLLDNVVYDVSFTNGDTVEWTSAKTGATATLYYRNAAFHLNSETGTIVSFSDGDTIVADCDVDYTYREASEGVTAGVYRNNLSNSYWRRGLSQEAQYEYAQQILADLQADLATRTTYTKIVNGVEVTRPISGASVEISGISSEVSSNQDGGYTATLTYSARYTYQTVAGVTVFCTILGRADSVAQVAGGNGSYIGSQTEDLSAVVDSLFNDIDNGDFTLTNRSLATNAGNNTYFNQGTINGTFDTLDILGNRRIYYTTVDMGAFENQVAKDSPITSVNGRSITLTVTTKVDAVDPTDGVTSLREALEMADILHERGYQDITIRLARAYEIQLDGEQGSLSVNSPVKIMGNAASINCEQSGCGLKIATDGEVIVSDLIIMNGVGTNGAGLAITSGDVTVVNSLIYACEAIDCGGAIYMGSTGTLNLYNTTIASSSAVYGPGVYSVSGSTVNVNNSIIATNRASKKGLTTRDVLFNGDYSINFSIIGNAGTAADAAALEARATRSQIGYGLDNAVDPLFISPTDGNFRVSATQSPAKNAGSSSLVYPGSVDLNGTSYSGALQVTLGAYQIGLEAPSTIVTTLEDIVDPTDGLISLREAVELYSGDNIAGAGCYSVDNSVYNAENAMNSSSVYGVTYYSPITFAPSLAGGTIRLSSPLSFEARGGNGVVTDYLIDASAVAGLGGITIDTSNMTSDSIFGRGAAFQLLGMGDPQDESRYYFPVHLDIRNVKITTTDASQTAISISPFSILTMRNCLAAGFGTAVNVGDNDPDSNDGGLAHIYNSTIIGGVFVGGEAFVYNSAITEGISIRVTQANPAYRQVHAYSSWIGGVSGLTGRYTGVNTRMGGSVSDLFINYSAGDYRPADRSWLINKGSNDYLMTLAATHADQEVDANGNIRLSDGYVDIGCYERAGVKDIPSTVVTTADDVDDLTDGLISIHEALAYAEQRGDTITFSSDLTGETINLTSPIAITRNVGFNGGSADVTINAQGVGSAFTIDIGGSVYQSQPNVYIQNLTITGGRATNGGAVNVARGNVYLGGLQIWGNEATQYGGAIYVYDSELSVVDSRIGGNTARYYGGIVNEFGKTVLTRSYVAENVGTNVNSTADIWGRAAVNYVNSKNNVVGSVADNIKLFDGVDNNRVGTIDQPLKPFYSASTGNLEVLPEFVIDPAAGATLDKAFETLFEEDELDVDLDDNFFDELFDEI
ncbi:MAG: caspase family protein [Thermoguttaceae bacterium]|nr:caspase family protein [Thermoguttaceae bacterium]